MDTKKLFYLTESTESEGMKIHLIIFIRKNPYLCF